MSPLRLCLLACAALAPAAAQAAAGQVLFALGRVEIQRAGQSLPAARGTPVEVGDTITTGPTGLAQVRMQDGALLSLRYGSTLVVEDFRLPAPAAAPVAVTPAAPAAPPSAAVAGGRSALRLLRGAFRTVTGLIGRNTNDAYSVATPVATIGIRGTDYSAAYCDGDCGATPDGLYVGVSNGGVEVSNDGGKLVLGNDQYGYVKDNATAPDRQLAPPEVLDAPIPPDEGGEEEGDRQDTETAAGEGAVPDSSVRDELADRLLASATQPEGDYELRPGAPGSYAYAHGAVTGSNSNGVYLDDRNALGGFLDGVFVSIGTATNTNLGADATTGLRWGRWTGGDASVGGSALDLSNSSLHWIYASSTLSPVLAITGTRNYTLVGNTDPTDSNGGVGFLADATLSADFTNQTVDSTLSVGFGDVASGGTLWQAAGQGSIASGLFEGTYSTVTVNGSAAGTSGDFAGFFTSGALAAGLTFELTDGITTVNGAAGFELAPLGIGGP
jgi:hypothetical protein